jgi:GTPase
LARLTETAGGEIVESVVERRDAIHPKTFIGSGQAEELGTLAKSLRADLIIFNEPLSPSQQHNLEDATGVRVIDRTGLILDIFARHATSNEGVIQVELAQSQYRLPRLRGRGVEMSRIGGGIGTRRGKGEQKLEIDRRRIQTRIRHLKKELEHLARVRETQSKRRRRAGVFEVCLVGYTNAGKSSLLNRLTGADVLVEDMLFATLDSTTRKLSLPAAGKSVVLSDTVGFIRDLPHELIAAFRSTLDGVREADLLLNVVDVADPEWSDRVAAVEAVLEEIGAADRPVLTVFNQVDRADSNILERLKNEYPDAAFVSAKTGAGLDELVALISSRAAERR